MTIKKNIEFCQKCEIRDRVLEWSDIEFCVGDLMLEEEIKELKQACEDKDIIEQIDAYCDIAVIAGNIPFKTANIQCLKLDQDLKATAEAMTEAFNAMSDLQTSEYDFNCLDSIFFALKGLIHIEPINLRNMSLVNYFAFKLHTWAMVNLVRTFYYNYSIGIDKASDLAREAFEIVCDSNLSKICKDGSVIIVDGKVKKPDTFVAPDFSELLNGIA